MRKICDVKITINFRLVLKLLLMQSNLNQFLGLSDSDSDSYVANLPTDQLQRGKHFWTGVKAVEQLLQPGKSDFDVYDDILSL